MHPSNGAPDQNRDVLGKYATMGQAEATGIVLDGPPEAPPLPAWGADLETAIVDGVRRWTDAHDSGHETVDLSEIVDGFDEDAMIEAYGEHRSDWLCGIQIESVVHTDQIRSHDLPTEYRIDGHLFVSSGDSQIGYSRFGDAAGEVDLSLLAHCPPAPSDGDCVVRPDESRNSTGSQVLLHDAAGWLQDAEDGTAAVRRFNTSGKLLEVSHHQAGKLHSPAPGAPARTEYRSDGSTLTERAQHGAVIDGPAGEPSTEHRTAHGTTVQKFVSDTGWTRTVSRDRGGNITSDSFPDPHTPGATLLTKNDPATGRSQITRKDDSQVEIDGANGEPAVEFRRHGQVTSQTWKTRGVWTKTTDYDTDGGMCVEFVNKNWPSE